MADICAHCKSADVGHAFDTFQCFACGGYTNMDGTPTVPTSAIEVEGATYDGPGADLLATPDPPLQAKNGVIR